MNASSTFFIFGNRGFHAFNDWSDGVQADCWTELLFCIAINAVKDDGRLVHGIRNRQIGISDWPNNGERRCPAVLRRHVVLDAQLQKVVALSRTRIGKFEPAVCCSHPKRIQPKGVQLVARKCFDFFGKRIDEHDAVRVCRIQDDELRESWCLGIYSCEGAGIRICCFAGLQFGVKENDCAFLFQRNDFFFFHFVDFQVAEIDPVIFQSLHGNIYSHQWGLAVWKDVRRKHFDDRTCWMHIPK